CVPSPSCPMLLLPQQYASPWTSSAQVYPLPPVVMVVSLAPANAVVSTATAELLLVVVPIPSCPKLFRPQQYATPATSAQLCDPPAATVVPAGSSGIAQAERAGAAAYPPAARAIATSTRTVRRTRLDIGLAPRTHNGSPG